MRSRFLLIPLLLLAFASTYALSQAPQSLKGEQAIRGRDAVTTVARLADKSYAGRLTGHIGYTNAAKWSLSHLQGMGLKGMLQPYPQPYSIVEGGQLTAMIDEARYVATMLTDFMPLLFSDSGQARAQSVFVGWGIHAPEYGYDDYAGVDVRGKFVVCFRGTPDNSAKWVYHDEHRTRMNIARGKGAKGLIYVYPRVIAHPNGDLNSGFLVAMISNDFFDRLLAVEGTTSEALETQLKDTKRPASLPLDAVIDLSVKARYTHKGEGYNVVAWLEGSDPTLKGEYVVIGAHLDGTGDHIGLRFPGAEDNASGCAVVIEIAKAFARNGSRPKRSVAFVLFGSEEQGGQGSAHFMGNLPPHITKVSAFINFDMVGMGSKANIGINAPMEMHRGLLESTDRNISVISNVRVIERLGVRSGDIVPFFKGNVPLATISSNGMRPENLYHQPGDVPGLMQPEIMEDISKLVFRFAFALCDSDKKQ